MGLDVLGNPFGLIRGLADGIESLFYEPYAGFVQGPGEFAEGVALGIKSLFGNTLGILLNIDILILIGTVIIILKNMLDTMCWTLVRRLCH